MLRTNRTQFHRVIRRQATTRTRKVAVVRGATYAGHNGGGGGGGGGRARRVPTTSKANESQTPLSPANQRSRLVVGDGRTLAAGPFQRKSVVASGKEYFYSVLKIFARECCHGEDWRQSGCGCWAFQGMRFVQDRKSQRVTVAKGPGLQMLHYTMTTATVYDQLCCTK